MDDNLAFGQKLRKLREAAGLSLREVARESQISAPFLSDIELGRRFPKDETLSLIAKKLKVDIDILKDRDTRSAISDLKRIAEAHPNLAFAFRAMVDQVNAGKLTPGDVVAHLKQLYDPTDR